MTKRFSSFHWDFHWDKEGGQEGLDLPSALLHSDLRIGDSIIAKLKSVASSQKSSVNIPKKHHHETSTSLERRPIVSSAACPSPIEISMAP
jgi:hypothetical protein